MKKNRLGNYLSPKEGFRKTLLIMKLSVLLLFVFMHVASANLLSQSRVTIEKQTATYQEIFDQIKRQTGLTVVYSNNELNKDRSVSSRFVDADVESVLRDILSGTNLGYELQDEFIILKRTAQQQQPANRNVPVSGRVTDEKGGPLAGVAVMVKGTSNGAVTDQNGQYRIVINFADGAVLRFSFLGRETQEIPYAGNNVINVTLKEDVQQVETVTVTTGYMELDKNRYVGALEQKKAEDLIIPGLSLEQSLQGQFSGMSVINTSGQVGSSPKIRVRGTSTILGNQEPVWVVDGVIQLDPLPLAEGSGSLAGDLSELREIASTAISWLNPNDIETITVLKDASATAIYGSRAANGVIVLTTKQAKPGEISVSYSGEFSMGQRPRYSHYDMMNSQELMQYAQEMYEDRDQYTNAVLPNGYAGILEKLQNKQITYDFILNFIPVRTKDFTWQFSVNAGLARNQLKNDNHFNDLKDYLNGTAIVKDESYSTFYAYKYIGLDDTYGRPMFDYMDIDPTDDYRDFLVVAGKTEPDFSGGFNTVIRYKNFSVMTQFSMSFGAQKRLPSFYSAYGAPTPEQNAPAILKNRWRKPGDAISTNIPSIPGGYAYAPGMDVKLPWRESPIPESPYEMYNLSDFRVADSDFIRCNTISVSYDLGERIAKKLYAQRMLFSVSMTNPFLITFDKKWNGYDPETGGWPARRMTSLSVRLTF